MNDGALIALALGANIGDRQAALRAAVDGLRAFVSISALSPVYETAAAYVTDQPAFLNAALRGQTKLAAEDLLKEIKNLESRIGRRPTFRYGPRVIDIDILFYDDLVMQTPDLILPHPRMAERGFVLRPLADIAPDWRHPQSGQDTLSMLAKIKTQDIQPAGSLS